MAIDSENNNIPDHRISRENEDFVLCVLVSALISVKEIDVEEESGFIVVTVPRSAELRVALPEGYEGNNVSCKFDVATRELYVRVSCPTLKACKTSFSNTRDSSDKPAGDKAPTAAAQSHDAEKDAQAKAEEEKSAALAAGEKSAKTADKTAEEKVLREKMKAQEERLKAAAAKKKTAEAIKTPKDKDKSKPMPAAAASTNLSHLKTVVAMGQSMAEKLRSAGAASDGDAMAEVMAKMQAMMSSGGAMSPEQIADMEASLDSILASASEGMPENLVQEIKSKAPDRWKDAIGEQTLLGVGDAKTDKTDKTDKTVSTPINRDGLSASALLSQHYANSAPLPAALGQGDGFLGRKRKTKSEKPALEISKEELAEKRKNEGNEEFKKKRYAAALNRYTEAVTLNPNLASAFSNRSLVHYTIKNYQIAVEDAEQCIRADSSFLKGYVRLATAQMELGDFNNAKITIRKGLAKDLNDSMLVKLLQEVKEREWEMEDEEIRSQHVNVKQTTKGDSKGKAKGREEGSPLASKDVRADCVSFDCPGKEEDIDDVFTPGAQKSIEAEAARKLKGKIENVCRRRTTRRAGVKNSRIWRWSLRSRGLLSGSLRGYGSRKLLGRRGLCLTRVQWTHTRRRHGQYRCPPSQASVNKHQIWENQAWPSRD